MEFKSVSDQRKNTKNPLHVPKSDLTKATVPKKNISLVAGKERDRRPSKTDIVLKQMHLQSVAEVTNPLEEEDFKSRMPSPRTKSPTPYDRERKLSSVAVNSARLHSTRVHSTGARSKKLKTRKQKYPESEGDASGGQLTFTKSNNGKTTNMSKKSSDQGRNTRTKDTGSSQMFKSHRTLANNSWASSGIGFIKSESQKNKAGEAKPEQRDSQIYKKYAPILVLEMQENNEYEFKASQF